MIATTANAEILVLRGPSGQLYLTNRGEKSGYKVISRYREFYGSSGMGLRSRLGGDPSKYEEIVRRMAERFALDPNLVKAVIRAESNFNPMATSNKGAMGLMQLMPDTARQHDVRNAYDAGQNVYGGTRHLRYLLDRYRGNLDLALAAYNAGTKPVDLARGIPSFPETQEYVRRVRDFHLGFRAATVAAKPVAPKAAEVAMRRVEGARTADELYGVPIVVKGEPRGPEAKADTGSAIKDL
jgi:soluble lytic murein transglycosylase-like protein